ncbi:LLM class F420-dependent oxidoreductase [Iamia sp. SCSIO 61187]|uniref:LLM class F420-dependent oxidoreductase n=1 Tax=Iamia sp. SCSIO 61187 TaxID=2722752 RepID=UPI001C62C680|nr:LLM class F420-dependent oxidoreductase [Iamia sp. SCSIO 61187]QYG92087.1 LLM class F420-dependent oxidoreductase [Iamia sp. SCSIO 61187]
MDIGVTVFQTDLSWHPGELAPELERRGFASLWIPEHTHIPTSRLTPPPTGDDVLDEMYKRTLDPFVALAYAAAATETLRIGTGILLPAQRDPIITAKEAATLDHLSGGRLDLGIGFGWNEDELAHHGVTMKQRRRVVEERMGAMQALWADEVAEYHGDFVDLGPSWAWPKPVQRVTRPGGAGGQVTRPGVPVLLGGMASPTVFGHVQRYCDGWIPIGGAGLTEAVPRFRAEVEAAGRDPATLRVTTFGTLPTPEKLAHYAAIGIDECVLRLPSAGRDEILRTLDDYAPYLP